MVLVPVIASGGMFASSSSERGYSTWPLGVGHASPIPDNTLLYDAVSPAVRGEVMAATADRLSRYTITAEFHPPGAPLPNTPQAPPGANPVIVPGGSPIAPPVPGVEATPARPTEQQATITGTQELRFVNDTGASLSELYLRLLPNLRQYGDGRMVVRDVTVDGAPVRPEPPPLYSVPASTPVATADVGSADLILLRLPLAAPLALGATATVRLGFTTTVPVEPVDGAGVFRFMPDAGRWTLGHWFPILAGYDPVCGWETEPPAAWEDVTFSNTALFDVTLTAPEDLVLVTTGVEVEGAVEGPEQVRRFVSGPARDFVIVADPELASVSTDVNGTKIVSYYQPHEEAGAEQILAWGAQSLAVFTELFGPYPYATLDLVAVPGVIGYEFPQLIFLGADYYPDPVTSGSRPGAVEFLVAHEVAHQWWYGLVGNNPHRHAFLDEGLAEYASFLYFERQHGVERIEQHVNRALRLPYATMVLTAGDQIVDQPSAAFPDEGTYVTTVYWKAALGFQALRGEVGEAAFVAGLKQYADTMRFGVAMPVDLQSALEDASGRDLEAFWHRWFETARGRVEIVMDPEPATPGPAAPVARPEATPLRATPVDGVVGLLEMPDA
jgi:hypothetical protein